MTSFEEAIAGCFLIVGTSGIITYGDKHFIRIPITPRELAERIKDQEDEVALVFGREDIGLTQEQLTRCDILVNIPSNEEYPILNLSHAATIVMYEIFASHGKPSNPKKATEFEKAVIASAGKVSGRVDLESQTLVWPHLGTLPFHIAPAERNALLKGLDDVELTLEHADAIKRWEIEARKSQPWLQTVGTL